MADVQVESFERLPGAPGWVTLRLEGRWSGDLAALGSPELVIDDGRRDFTFPPASGAGTGIPSPGQRVWRVAFDGGDDGKPANDNEVAAFHAGLQARCPAGAGTG